MERLLARMRHTTFTAIHILSAPNGPLHPGHSRRTTRCLSVDDGGGQEVDIFHEAQLEEEFLCEINAERQVRSAP